MSVPALAAISSFAGTAPTNVIMTAFSPDGKYVAFGRSSSSPYFQIYKIGVNFTLTEIPYPRALTSRTCTGLAWHPTISGLLATHDNLNFLQCYQVAVDESQFETTANSPYNGNFVSSVSGSGIAWSPDGTRLALSRSATNAASVYVASFNSSTYILTGMTQSSTEAGANVGKYIKFIDNNTLFVVHIISNTIRIKVYAYSGSAWARVGSTLYTSGTIATIGQIDNYGPYYAIAGSISPYLIVLKLDMSTPSAPTVSQIMDPLTLPSNALLAVRWNSDGTSIITGDATTPRMEYWGFDASSNYYDGTNGSGFAVPDPSATPVWIGHSPDQLLWAVAMGATGVQMYGNNLVNSYGTPSFPGFTAAVSVGLYAPDVDINGTPSFPQLTASSTLVAAPHETVPNAYQFVVSPVVVNLTMEGATMSLDVPSPFVYAEWSLPAFTMAPNIHLGVRVVDGKIGLSAFRASGMAGWTTTINDGIDLPSFRSTGSVNVEEGGFEGRWNLPAYQMTMEAEIDPDFGALLDHVPFPKFTAQGEVDAPQGTITTAVLPKFGAAGVLHVLYSVRANFTLPKFIFEGRGPDPIVSAPSNFMLPKFLFDMDASRPTWSVGAFRLPSLTTDGHVNVPTGILGAMTLPKLQAAGYVFRALRIDSNFRFPVITMRNFGGPQTQVYGACVFPVLTGSGQLGMHNSVRAAMMFPALTMRGRLGFGEDGGGIGFVGTGTFSVGSGISLFNIDYVKIG